MTTTRTAARPGLSLLEVIVALFVMALGMISLLTLFPLGAIQMGQALRDARAAETVSQADTHMRLWWQRDVVEPPQRNPAVAEDPAFTFLDNPQNGMAALVAPFDGNPSYPVVIDPIGFQAYPPTLPANRKNFLSTNALFPRRTMNWIDNPSVPVAQQPAFRSAFSFRTATMMDDITFNPSALPYDDVTITPTTVPNPPPLIVRQGRYNWAAVIQRPVNANRYVADLKILVFDGRPPGIAPANAEVILNPAFGATVGATQLTLTANASADFLRAGNWIMDGTLDPSTGRRNAVWYRIQSLDRDSLPGSLIIDLQTPLLRAITPPPVLPATTPASQFYVFKGLIEVFDRPQLAPPDYKPQVP